jgi:nitrite reductase/ring-hydroxylating ferredoxin subunit
MTIDISALQDNSSFGISVEGRNLLVARRGDNIYLYENRCPHTSETLDPEGGSVSNADGGLMTCQRHAAQFITETGECVAGPCLGEALVPVAFTHHENTLYLD